MAGLIGEAGQYKVGLMPADYTKYNYGGTTPLDFNESTDIGRMYSSYNSINGPIAGNYYWGIFNIGWNSGYLVQIACGSYSTDWWRIYARSRFSNNAWTSWKQIV